jgi:hypothetical protein
MITCSLHAILIRFHDVRKTSRSKKKAFLRLGAARGHAREKFVWPRTKLRNIAFLVSFLPRTPVRRRNPVKKRFIIAAAALLTPAFVPSLASAAPPAPPAAQEQLGEHHRFSDEDRAAFTEARIAALKAGLKLTPAQEKNWPAVETAIRDLAKARAARFAEWRDKEQDHEGHKNLIEALQRHAKALEAHAGEMTKLADAAKPLYDSLDDAQKRRFAILLHAIGKPHGEHWGHHEHEEAEGHE